MTSQKTKAMIQSMTGYGESSYESNDVYLHVSIKTVNSKYLDVDAHLPRAFAQQEMLWRKLFTHQLRRGRVFFTLTCQLRSLQASEVLNEDLLQEYTQFLKKLCISLDINKNILTGTLRLPGVVRSELMHNVSEEVQSIATQTVLQALQHCVTSRQQEAQTLVAQLQTYLSKLDYLLDQIDEHVTTQETILRSKLKDRLTNLELNPQEWEQELTSHLSKISIEEEKVRLKSHFDFFTQTLAHNHVVGKKLTFIIQELGRELNTIGAKAQHGPLQHLAVNMKEIVEQMREQTANLV